MRYFSIAAAVILVAVIPALAQEIPDCSDWQIYPDTALVRDAAAACIIVRPSGGNEYAAAAETLAEGLQKRYGTEFQVVPDTQVCPERISPIGEQFRVANLILLGNVHTNRAFLHFYAGFRCGADSHYPGGEGYEIRSICNPWGNGHNVLIVGASTPAGIRSGVQRFLQIAPDLQDGQAILPHTVDIQPGESFQDRFDAWNAEAERWEFQPFAARDHVAIHLYGPAIKYQWTGNDKWAAAARDVIHFFNKVYEDQYPISDYEFDPWFRAWDFIDEHPVFTEDDLDGTIPRMVETAFKMQRCGSRGARYAGTRHTTQGSLGAFTSARYINRTFPDNERLQELSSTWIQERREHFHYCYSGYRDDRDSTESMDSIISYLRWALQEQAVDYFDSGHARQSAQYCLTYHDSLGHTCGIDGYAEACPGNLRITYRLAYVFRSLAFALQDPQMLWFHENFPPGREFGLHYWRPWWEAGCFSPAPDMQAAQSPPEYLLGLSALPVSKRRYDIVADGRGGLGPGISEEMPPQKQTIDKLCFREGFSPEDQYLLLQGFQGCLIGTVDGNTIPRFTDRGHIWLFHHTDNIGHYYHNGLFVSNGFNNDALQAACRLDAAGRFDDFAMTSTTLPEYRGTDWQRAIFWMPGEWFFVMDRATANEAGRYATESVWRTPLYGSWTDDTHFATTAGDATFHIISSHPVEGSAEAEPPDGAARPFVLRERKSGEFAAGEVIDFHNLLCVTDAGADPAYTPLRINDSMAAIHDADGGPVLVGVGGGQDAFGVSCDSGLYAITDSAAYVAGVKYLKVGERTIVDSNEPVTARIDFTDGTRTPGMDGDALKATSLTWEMPEPQSTKAGGTAGALRGVLEKAASADVRERGPGALHDSNHRVEQGDIRVDWTCEAAGTKGAPIEGIRINSESEYEGPLPEVIDGLLPGRGGPLHWPEGQPATFELSWDEPRTVSELRVHIGLIAPGERPDLAEQIDDARELTLEWMREDGSGDAPQTVSADQEINLRNNGKGYIQSHGYLRARVPDVRAKGVKITVPPPAENKSVNITEVEVLTPRRGPLAVRHLRLADLNGDGEVEAVVQTGEGLLTVLDSSGDVQWQHQFRGRLTEVVPADINDDGELELLCACYDEHVHALSASGDLLWSTSFIGLRERSNSEYCTNGALAHTVGFWHPRPGVGRVLVGHYWYTSLLDPEGEELLHARVSGRHRTVLKPAMDLDEDGSEEVLVAWDKPWQGTAGVTTMGDGETMYENRTVTPNGVPYLAEILPGDDPRFALGTSEGFGFYDPVAGEAIWEYVGGRPYSAGCVHDTDGDGSVEFISGGRDGFVSVLAHDGTPRGAHLVESPVNDIAATGSGDASIYLVATDSGLQVYDSGWRHIGYLRDPYQHISVLGDVILAATDDARIQCLSLR